MRMSGVLATLLVTAVSALAADTAIPETLTLRSVKATRHGGRLVTGFDVPTDAGAQDLRDDAVTVRIGSGEPVVAGGDGLRLRVSRDGRRARFAAPRRAKLRVARFDLSTKRGSFVVTLGGGRIFDDAPPPVELSFAGHVYRWPAPAVVVPPRDPYVPPPPPAPVLVPDALPDGPVGFTDIYHQLTVSSQPLANVVIRSADELSAFLAPITFAGDTPPGFTGIDFRKEMIVVVANYSVVEGVSPWKVELRTVTSSAGRIEVAYDRFWGPMRAIPEAGEMPNPPMWTNVQAVRVPATTAPVDFTSTPVKSSYPW